MRPEHLRVARVGDASNRVVFVGVVHDHPASVYRVASIVHDEEPAVVALELPPLAIPLFERFAVESTTPGDPGGEMSAAIRAAETAEIRGIDMPTASYVRALVGTVREAAPALNDVRDVAVETYAVARHAVQCRLAAADGSLVPTERPVDPLDHDCSFAAPPDVQAEHEAASLTRSRSLLGALEPPVAAQVTDTAREKAMARRLAALGRRGTVVAVVGFDHLDEIADRVAGGGG